MKSPKEHVHEFINHRGHFRVHVSEESDFPVITKIYEVLEKGDSFEMKSKPIAAFADIILAQVLHERLTKQK